MGLAQDISFKMSGEPLRRGIKIHDEAILVDQGKSNREIFRNGFVNF